MRIYIGKGYIKMFLKYTKSLRNRVLVGTALSSLFISTPIMAQAAERANYDIKPQSLSSALLDLGKQGDIEVLYVEADLKGKATLGFEGVFSPGQAAEQLLADAGIAYRMDANGTLLVGNAYNRKSADKKKAVADNEGTAKTQPARFQIAQVDQERNGNVAASQAQGAETPQKRKEEDTIVVTGTRSQANRTALDSPVPVDVFSIGDLTTTGRTELNQILAATVPSFNFNQTAINDGSDIIRPATLRGLGPDETLVLVNGKRRHTSALLNLNGGGRGSAAVDLNSIPSAAIGSVQVLRDGASAQYGSDAIAGVINIILRKDDTGGDFSAQYGAFATNIPANGRGKVWDGQTVVLKGWKGFSIGNGGHFTVSAEYKDRGTFNRAGIDQRRQFVTRDASGAIATGGNLDPREITFNRLNHIYGAARSRDFSTFADAGLPIGENAELYAFAGFQDRRGRSPGFYRRSQDATSPFRGTPRNLTEIFPDGFLPEIVGDITDYSVGVGIKGEINDWRYDVSGVFGDNKLDYTIDNTLNASLGPSSPTQFDAGALEFDQQTFNADIAKQFGTVSLAFGAEYRREGYKITAGEPGSFINGGYRGIPGVNYIPNPGVNVPVGFDINDPSTFPDPFDPNFGVGFSGGSQVFAGFTPQSAIDKSRETVALYTDTEWQLTDQFLVTGALRYEHFSDFGDIVTGKISSRYDLNDTFAIRGTFSKGFRAPSVQQLFFTSSATVFIDGIPNEVGTFRADSPAAKALGGGDLRPEKSDNYSAGVVMQMGNGVYATVDAYKININNRIVLTENLQGADVLAVLAANGVTGVNRARFFINGVDTHSRGLDVVLGYKGDIPWGHLDISAALNITDTNVVRTPTNPALPNLTLFSASNTISFEQGAPRNKLVLNANLTTNNGHSFNLRGTRYGRVTIGSNTPSNVYDLESKFIFDASAFFKVSGRVTMGGGMDNIFDTYPSPPSAAASGTFTGGIFPFSSRSPFGFAGRFVYAKISYNY